MSNGQLKPMPVEFKGKLVCKLIFDYNQEGKDAKQTYEETETLEERFEVRTVVEEVNTTAKTKTNKNNVSLNFGAAIKLLSASIGSSFESSVEVCEFMSKRIEQNANHSRQWKKEMKNSHEVYSDSQLALYRLYFMAPGVICPGGLVNDEREEKEVYVIINVQPIELIGNLTVEYGDSPSDAPTQNRVQEINKQNDVISDDLNKDFKGKFTWLVADYTTNVEDAATNFLVWRQPHEKHDMTDIARGTGGDYRYVRAEKNKREKRKITQINLLRSSTSVAGPPNGYSGISVDINQGRKKDFLYLIWKTTDTST